MRYFDDPFGDEARCPECDRLGKYNDLTREYECSHDDYIIMLCLNCDWEYDGMLSEADEDWTVACPECGGRVRVTIED